MVLVKVVSKSHSQNVVEVKGRRQKSNDLQNVTIKTLPYANNYETTANIFAQNTRNKKLYSCS